MILSDAVLRGLLEAAPDGLVAVASTGHILFANQRTEELFGWAPGELVGATVELLVPTRFGPRHPQLRAGYAQDPVPRPMGLGRELSARRRDGSEFPAEISLSTIETDDGATIILAAIRDVTERLEIDRERNERALEAERERSHRLESIGQLAGGIAHDFNNLLGVILNYATLAERSIEDQAVADDLAQIRAAAERAAGLTRQLLAFARQEVTRPEVVALGDLVANLGRMLERTLGERFELHVEVDDDAVFVLADPQQLEQIVLNLCLNARDALPAGGEIRVRVGPVLLGDDRASLVGLPAGRTARLCVSDRGTGMAPEVVERAFEPFFTTKPAGEGTGLGLATVHGAVHQNGGRVLLDSAVGSGTSVEIFLPVAAAPEPCVAPQPEPLVAGDERILLVEDEARLREVVARMLEEHGYRVTLAADADAALELVGASGEPFDLLLTDVVMPGRSGPELVAEVRRQHGTVAPPVLFTTGYAATEDLDAERVLAKPYTERDLLRAVRAVLDD